MGDLGFRNERVLLDFSQLLHLKHERITVLLVLNLDIDGPTPTVVNSIVHFRLFLSGEANEVVISNDILPESSLLQFYFF